MLGVVAIGLVVLVLLPSVRTARGPALRTQCTNHTKQIMLALLQYQAKHGSLPPAYTVDDQGSPLHSWRTLILPFIEQQALYDSIDLTKPWDDPVNASAREAVVEIYLCPGYPYEDRNYTTYLAVVGPDAIFSDATPRTAGELKGLDSGTIVVIEMGSRGEVHWMSPHDTTIEEVVSKWPDLRSHHGGVAIAGYLDGSVDLIPRDIDPEELRAMLTVRSVPPSEP